MRGLLNFLRSHPRAAKPLQWDFGIDAALADRKAARPARQEAAKRAAETRREKMA